MRSIPILKQESAKPRGAFLPSPKDGEDPTIDALKADVRTAAGALLFVETMVDGVGVRAARRWRRNGRRKNFGPTMGAGMVQAAKMARSEALAALGYE